MPPVTPRAPHIDVAGVALSEGCPPPRCADHGEPDPSIIFDNTRPGLREGG